MQSMQAWCLHWEVRMMQESFSMLQTEQREFGMAMSWEDRALSYRIDWSSSE